METGITWTDFLELLGVLLVLYWILKFLGSILRKLTRKTSTKRIIGLIFSKGLIVFKPIAAVLLSLAFIGVNYKVHGILFLIVGVLVFSYAKSYLNGIAFKTNPLVYKGAHVISGDHEGEMLQLLPFGILIQETGRKSFVNYSDLEKNGFSILSKGNDVLRTTLYLPEAVVDEVVLDLMFDNPLVSFKDVPTLEKVSGQATKKLLFSMEKGAKVDDVIAYLVQYNINPTL